MSRVADVSCGVGAGLTAAETAPPRVLRSTASPLRRGSDVAFQDRGLGQAGQALADASGPGVAHAVHRLQVLDCGAQEALEAADREPSLAGKGVHCSEVREERWGSLTRIKFPGGGEIGLYQPKHPTALGLNE